MINKLKGVRIPTLIIDEKQRQYFLGFHSTFGYLLLADKTYFYTDSRYLYSAKECLEKEGVCVLEYKGLGAIKSLLEEKGIKTLGIDYNLTTLSEFKSLKTLGVKFKDVSAKLEKLFSVKNATELKLIKKACDIAQKAFYETLPFIKKGVSEKQVANHLEYNMKRLGAEKVSFETIVAFGKNSAVPHHETSDAVLEDNQPILIDFGCVYKGYCSDCTRTMFFGKPTEKFLTSYSATLKANLNAEEKITAGINGKVADAYARDILKEVNLADYFTHSLGHGIGVNVHEYPYLSPKKQDNILKNGMVFSIEPGVYFDGEFGIRIEDTCVLKAGKVQRLFNDDKNLILL